MIKLENYEVVGWEPAIRGMRNPMNSHDKSDSSFREIAMTSYLNEDGEVKKQQVYFDALNVGPNDHSLMTKLRNAGTDHRKFMRYLDVCVDITAPLYWWKEFKTYRHGRKFMDEEDFFDYDDDEILEMHIEMNSCSTMHKIHDKEFTLEDFSTEHLIGRDAVYEDCFDLINDHGVDSECCPTEFMKLTCGILNFYRTKFLETKDKKYWWQMIQLLPSSYNQKRTVKMTYEVLARMYRSRKHHKLDEWREFCKWIESLPYSEIVTGKEET